MGSLKNFVNKAFCAFEGGAGRFKSNTLKEGAANVKVPKRNRAYTLTEVVVVMLIIAVVVGVCIKIMKTKLNNITTYTYYSAYSTLKSVTSEMMKDFKATNTTLFTDDGSTNTTMFFNDGSTFAFKGPDAISKKKFLNFISRIFTVPAYAAIHREYYCPSYSAHKIKQNLDLDVRTQVWNARDEYYHLITDVYYNSETNMFYNTSPSFIHNCQDIYDFSYDHQNHALGKPLRPELAYSHSSMIKCEGKYYNGAGHAQYFTFDTPGTPNPCTSRCYTFEEGKGLGGPVRSNNCGAIYLSTNPISCLGPFEIENFPTGVISDIITNCVANFDPDPEPDPTPDPPTPPVCTPTPCTGGNEFDLASCSCKCNKTRPAVIPCDKKWSQEQCQLVDKTPWPPVCPIGQEFSPKEDVCGCIPVTPTIPRTGKNYCELFVNYSNTSPSLISGGEECKGDNIADGTTDFLSKTPDIILRNGMQLYNVSKNPEPIAVLAGNSRGGKFTKADGTEVKIDEWGYTVYVDIDGERGGEGKLWEDVYPFYVTLSGYVIPAYDKDNAGEYGGDSTFHLQTSVLDQFVDTNGRNRVWITKSKSFKESACKMGYVKAETPYCSTAPAVTTNASCQNSTHDCKLKSIMPIKFFK